MPYSYKINDSCEHIQPKDHFSHYAADRPTPTIGGKMLSGIRKFVLCSRQVDDDDDEKAPSLQIGHPTNFRREDITIAGLSPHDQSFIRDKAISDAKRIWASSGHRPETTTEPTSLPPPLLHHSSSFTSHPVQASDLHFGGPTATATGTAMAAPVFDHNHAPPPTYAELARPPSPAGPVSPLGTPVKRTTTTGGCTTTATAAALERVRAHTRKISDSVRASLMLGPRPGEGGEDGGWGRGSGSGRTLLEAFEHRRPDGKEGREGSGDSFDGSEGRGSGMCGEKEVEARGL